MINGIHIYQGNCPDDANGPYARDENCPVCKALILADELEPRKEIFFIIAGDGKNIKDREVRLTVKQ